LLVGDTALMNRFDFFNFHTYQDSFSLTNLKRDLAYYNNLLGRFGKPLWITEFNVLAEPGFIASCSYSDQGSPSNYGSYLNFSKKAVKLVNEAKAYAQSKGVPRIYWFMFSHSGEAPGFLNYDSWRRIGSYDYNPAFYRYETKSFKTIYSDFLSSNKQTDFNLDGIVNEGDLGELFMINNKIAQLGIKASDGVDAAMLSQDGNYQVLTSGRCFWRYNYSTATWSLQDLASMWGQAPSCAFGGNNYRIWENGGIDAMMVSRDGNYQVITNGRCQWRYEYATSKWSALDLVQIWGQAPSCTFGGNNYKIWENGGVDTMMISPDNQYQYITNGRCQWRYRYDSAEWALSDLASVSSLVAGAPACTFDNYNYKIWQNGGLDATMVSRDNNWYVFFNGRCQWRQQYDGVSYRWEIADLKQIWGGAPICKFF